MEVIKQIRALAEEERAKVVRFVIEHFYALGRMRALAVAT